MLPIWSCKFYPVTNACVMYNFLMFDDFKMFMRTFALSSGVSEEQNNGVAM